jgi:hypothetical protein
MLAPGAATTSTMLSLIMIGETVTRPVPACSWASRNSETSTSTRPSICRTPRAHTWRARSRSDWIGSPGTGFEVSPP